MTRLWWLLLLVPACIWWVPGLGQTDDDARMILEARKLWAGGGLPEHFSHVGMIALLAPVSHSLVLCHLPVWACYGLLVVGVWRLTDERGVANKVRYPQNKREGLPGRGNPYGLGRQSLVGIGNVLAGFERCHPGTRFATVATVALSPWILYWSAEVMTEVPFTAATVWSLYFAKRRKWLPALVVGLLAVSFRSIGVTVVAAVLVGWIVQERRQDWWAAIAWPAGVGVAIWWVKRTHGDLAGGLLRGTPYTEPISWAEFPARVGFNAWAYVSHHVPEALMPPEALPWPWLYAVVVAGLLTASAVGLWRMRSLVLGVYLVAYGAALLVWPEILGGSRYIVPLLPILLVGLTRRVPPGGRKPVLKTGVR